VREEIATCRNYGECLRIGGWRKKICSRHADSLCVPVEKVKALQADTLEGCFAGHGLIENGL
jgi:hypothetical protein